MTVSDAATVVAEAAPIENSLWSQLMNSPAPPAIDVFHPALAADAVSPPEPEALEAREALEVSMPSADQTVTVASAEVVVSPRPSDPVSPEPIRTEPIRIEPVRIEPAKPQAALLPEIKTEAAYVPRVASKAPTPAPVNKRPAVPVPPQRRGHRVAFAAAAVFLGAIGVGAYWLRTHEQAVLVPAEQPTLVAKDLTAERQPPVKHVSTEATPAVQVRKSATAPTPVSVRPKPAGPAPAPIAAVPVPNLVTEAPAPPPPAPEVVAAVSPPAPPAPASGPFFETTDVNEMPKVATRVEPLLPDELRARPVNEIVVVRVLVSQGGHPSRVNLLRRSKAGLRLDNAIIAAVNQWTFSPARKRGQAVSCWFNFGVPVGGAD